MHESRADELKSEPIGDLVKRLANETTTLVRQEIALAKVELAEKARAAGAGAGFLAAAAVLGLGAFGALTACIIAVLALAVPLWGAALAVAIVYGIIAVILAQSGRSKLAQVTPIVPQQTTQTVKEDVEWIKARAQSGKR